MNWKHAAFLAALAVVPSADAAESRIWMSRKGTTLEAELGTVQPPEVTLIDKNMKSITLKIEDLSLADRQYLIEYGDAPEDILASGKPGLVEKEMRLDTSAFEKPDKELMIPEGPSEPLELFKTPHFLIASAGKVRPQPIAETAERMWFGMAFEHMNFRRDWGDKRMLIILAEDRDMYAALGKWQAAVLRKMGQPDAATNREAIWDRIGSSDVYLDDAFAKEHGVFDTARIFNIREPRQFRKDMAPFLVHCMADALLTKQMGGVSSYGSEGYFSLTTGHSYYKEISLAGKSETQLLAVEESNKDEISSKSGFDDGSSWARSLKPLVRKGVVALNLEHMLSWKSDDLDPAKLVTIYSFACYMEGDSKRLAQFAKLIRRIESSNQIPVPQEFARIFGFETVEELEADWKKFIVEGDFK
ncbi:MAG: hypothetical protein KDN05_05960 [Verrucomicrobiae bacterium]|nr:hypothetical protein [Verrucomicrobiae bacterium]MCP5543439.1 hypothetical protein [Akkermansiaceae bacterium]MCP5546779.1 hypothetical protein [Akkermansiaceae bacterium]